jgi:hypothetical protein
MKMEFFKGLFLQCSHMLWKAFTCVPRSPNVFLQSVPNNPSILSHIIWSFFLSMIKMAHCKQVFTCRNWSYLSLYWPHLNPPKFSFYCSSYVSTWWRKKQPSSMCKPITQHWNQQTIYQTLHPTCAIASQKSSMCINIIWLQLCVAPHTIYTHLYSGNLYSKNERFMFTISGFNPTLQATD